MSELYDVKSLEERIEFIFASLGESKKQPPEKRELHTLVSKLAETKCPTERQSVKNKIWSILKPHEVSVAWLLENKGEFYSECMLEKLFRTSLSGNAAHRCLLNIQTTPLIWYQQALALPDDGKSFFALREFIVLRMTLDKLSSGGVLPQVLTKRVSAYFEKQLARVLLRLGVLTQARKEYEKLRMALDF